MYWFETRILQKFSKDYARDIEKTQKVREEMVKDGYVPEGPYHEQMEHLTEKTTDYSKEDIREFLK